jgi:hypothetical protein
MSSLDHPIEAGAHLATPIAPHRIPGSFYRFNQRGDPVSIF